MLPSYMAMLRAPQRNGCDWRGSRERLAVEDGGESGQCSDPELTAATTTIEADAEIKATMFVRLLSEAGWRLMRLKAGSQGRDARKHSGWQCPVKCSWGAGAQDEMGSGREANLRQRADCQCQCVGCGDGS